MEDANSRRELTLLEKAAESLPGVLYQFRISAQGEPSFIYVSRGAEALWELTPEEVTTNFPAVQGLVHPDDAEAFQRSIEVSARELTVWRNEHRIVARSGAVKWIQAFSRPERRPNGDVVFSGVLLDVTEHKESESQLKRLVDRLSTPLISVWEGVLVLPLIGDLNTARIESAIEELLPRIARDGVKSVILDLTGMMSFEHDAAQALLACVRAVGLLGSEALLTGITPAVAQTIVGLDVDLSAMRTYGTVAQALQRILKQSAPR